MPTGGCLPGERDEEAAQRELAEEIGLAAGRLERLAPFDSSKSVVDERATVFAAHDLARPRPRSSDDTENLQVAVFPFAGGGRHGRAERDRGRDDGRRRAPHGLPLGTATNWTGGGDMTGQLDGKVCVVTGAGNGIGRACALRFAEEGGAVVAADLLDEQGQAVADEIDGRRRAGHLRPPGRGQRAPTTRSSPRPPRRPTAASTCW